MTMLRTAAQWLNAQRDAHLAEPVTYCTADGASLPTQATRGETTTTARDEYGVVVRVTSRDFIFSAENLPLTPAYGDTITAGGAIFEVLAPNGGTPWRWTDSSQTAKRVHTKYLKEAENAEK